MESNIYWGDRGSDFKTLIRTILKKGNIKDKYVNKLLTPESLKVYNTAFTHPTANSKDNYEFLEILGDGTVNKSIIWYFSRRFPQINCSEGVTVLARLKIVYVSKKTFASFGEKMGFWKFISADMDTRNTKMKKTLEDVFEAFFGATEKLLDEYYMVGVGYSIVYDIISSLFNELTISLDYEKLYDAKSRLKEVFDYYNKKDIYTDYKQKYMRLLRTNHLIKAKVEYKTERVENTQPGQYGFIHHTKVYINYIYLPKINRAIVKPIEVGYATASLQADAEQKAAEQALKYLKDMGIYKDIPEIYKTFCK